MSADPSQRELAQKLGRTALTVALLGSGVFALTLILFLVQTGIATPWLDAFKSFMVLDSARIWWYITRASGIMGYLLLWLSVVLGFAISTKIFDPLLGRIFTYDFHEHLSLLSLGFVVLHAFVLLFDPTVPFTLAQLLVPFASQYRPLWVGFGIIGFYLSLLVTVTFYLRSFISAQLFRRIHTLSVVAYLGATLHGLYAGTDTALAFMQTVYRSTSLVSVFLLVYWLVISWMQRREKASRLA